MKNKLFALLSLSGLALCGCNDNKQNDNVVSQHYIHKYGYAVSQEEWESKNYPGQVVTHLNTGVTTTTTYENGIKHGPMTHTFPHSQTVEFYSLYNQGNKVKEISYDIAGMPVEEWIQLSPTRFSITMWYQEGSPMMVEEFVGEELLEGQYFSADNELESKVEKGSGLRTRRDRSGTLLAKESIAEGYATKIETFYPSGVPESIALYFRNQLQGERRTFSQTGEPLAIEDWVNGELHGKATYFKNGNRYLEISYVQGEKNGIERHFIDGNIVSQEIAWVHNQKHGEAVFYSEGKPESHWFYEGQHVSKRKFDELNKLDEIISRLPYSEGNLPSR
jgi:antitoxin component YwqK of YwqJK toxin-antitoxin module